MLAVIISTLDYILQFFVRRVAKRRDYSPFSAFAANCTTVRFLLLNWVIEDTKHEAVLLMTAVTSWPTAYKNWLVSNICIKSFNMHQLDQCNAPNVMRSLTPIEQSIWILWMFFPARDHPRSHSGSLLYQHTCQPHAWSHCMGKIGS